MNLNCREYNKKRHKKIDEHLNNWPDRNTPRDEQIIWFLEEVILSIKPYSLWWRMGMIRHLRAAITIINERGKI